MFLENYGSTLLKSGITLAELVKRPELDYDKLAELDEAGPGFLMMSENRLILRLSMKDI